MRRFLSRGNPSPAAPLDNFFPWRSAWSLLPPCGLARAYIGIALLLIVTVPSSWRCRMTSSGSEATAASPVLPTLSVTVPGPDAPKVISSRE